FCSFCLRSPGLKSSPKPFRPKNSSFPGLSPMDHYLKSCLPHGASLFTHQDLHRRKSKAYSSRLPTLECVPWDGSTWTWCSRAPAQQGRWHCTLPEGTWSTWLSFERPPASTSWRSRHLMEGRLSLSPVNLHGRCTMPI